MSDKLQIKKDIEKNALLLEEARRLLDSIINMEQQPVLYTEEELALIESWNILSQRQIELMTLSLNNT